MTTGGHSSWDGCKTRWGIKWGGFFFFYSLPPPPPSWPPRRWFPTASSTLMRSAAIDATALGGSTRRVHEPLQPNHGGYCVGRLQRHRQRCREDRKVADGAGSSTKWRQRGRGGTSGPSTGAEAVVVGLLRGSGGPCATLPSSWAVFSQLLITRKPHPTPLHHDAGFFIHTCCLPKIRCVILHDFTRFCVTHVRAKIFPVFPWYAHFLWRGHSSPPTGNYFHSMQTCK